MSKEPKENSFFFVISTKVAHGEISEKSNSDSDRKVSETVKRDKMKSKKGPNKENNSKIVIFLLKNLVIRSKITTFAAEIKIRDL